MNSGLSPTDGLRNGRHWFNDAGEGEENFAGYIGEEKEDSKGDITFGSFSRYSRSARLYLESCIANEPRNITKAITIPTEMLREGKADLFLYEHTRLFLNELRVLVSMLDEVCTVATCPSMNVLTKWLFLCACHPEPMECCAIDYSKHTLTASAFILSSTDTPTRAQLTTMSQRLLRIAAHAAYHHKDVFSKFESATFANKRFSSLLVTLKIVSENDLLVPLIQRR